MSKIALVIGVAAVLLISAPAFAVDGVVLINQSTVLAAGGFPFKITQPGSYKLSGNLAVSAVNVDGIDIEANNVTLDLNGFTISGPVSCTFSPNTGKVSCNQSSTGTGVNDNLNSGVTLRNGSVSGFGFGVNINTSTDVVGGLVEEIRVTSNSGIGIQVIDSVLRRSVSGSNLGDGILALASTVTENVSVLNGASGACIEGGLFANNTFENNAGSALDPSCTGVSGNDNDCDFKGC